MEAYGELGVSVAEFGTRRRHSFHVHDLVVETLKKYGKNFVGTSNVHFARITASNRSAHMRTNGLCFMLPNMALKWPTVLALEHWIDVYRGDLGIALSDTLPPDEFLRGIR